MRTVKDRAKALIDHLPRPLRFAVRRSYYAQSVRAGRFASEEPDLRLACRFLRSGEWVIDVGANVGHYTLPLGKVVGPNGRVIAIEPVPETFQLLLANVQTSRLRNVTALSLAASSRPRLEPMSMPRFADGRRNPYQARLGIAEGTPVQLRVLCLPVDRFLSEHPIRLVKIDSEGHEREVLAGMVQLLKRDRPVLIIEASPGHRHPMLDRLGYSCLRVEDSPNLIYASEEDLSVLISSAAQLGTVVAAPEDRANG